MITTNCTVTDFICNTALKVYTPYTASQVQHNTQNSCNSGATLTPYKYTCTDNQNVYATPSSTLLASVEVSSFSGRANTAFFNLFYLNWIGYVTILLALGIITFLTYMKRR